MQWPAGKIRPALDSVIRHGSDHQGPRVAKRSSELRELQFMEQGTSVPSEPRSPRVPSTRSLAPFTGRSEIGRCGPAQTSW